MSSKIIDEIDVKILKDLLLDGRRKFITIAEEAHVTKDVICQHYANMKKEGIIAGATVMINYAALGYDVNASISLTVPIQKRQLVIEQLNKIPGLYDTYQWGSNSSLWAVLHLNSTRQIENVERFVKRIPATIKSEFEIWVGVRFILATNLSILSTKDPPIETNIKMTKECDARDLIELDKVDRQIIEQLVFDGRAPFSNIATKTGTSSSTVMRRFQELVDRQVIKPMIQINPSKLGYPVDASFRLRTNAHDDLGDIADKISKIPDVYAILKILGAYDFRVFTCVRNFEHLFHLENQIANVTGVQEVEKATVLQLTLGCLPFPGTPISNF